MPGNENFVVQTNSSLAYGIIFFKEKIHGIINKDLTLHLKGLLLAVVLDQRSGQLEGMSRCREGHERDEQGRPEAEESQMKTP